MSDPLSDPRAQRLLSASPGEVGSLAAAFRHVADQAASAAGALRGARADATWTGTAAEAFRAQVGKLPGDLDKVGRSYADVADALDSYEPALGSLQSQFRNLASALEGARGALNSAQGQLAGARTALSSATSAPNVKPNSPAVVNAHAAVDQLSGTVGRAQGEVSALEGQGMRLLDEFDQARGRARSAVSGAAGIAPSQSWLSSALAEVGSFVSGVAHVDEAVGKFVVGALVNIGKSVRDLADGKAILDFIEHPSWKTFGALAKDVAVTASLVAMVVAPFAAPELLAAEGAEGAALGAEGAAAGAEGAAAGAEGAAAGAEGAAAGAEGAAAGTGAAESGASSFGTAMRFVSNGANDAATIGGGLSSVSDAAQGHWAEAGVDAFATVAPNLGSLPRSVGQVNTLGDTVANVAGIGEKQAASAEAIASQMHDLQGWTSYGLNPVAAGQLAFRDGVVPEALRGADLTSPAGIQAAAQNATSVADRAANAALHVGRPVAIGFDNLVNDPTQEAIKHRLDPCAGAG
jgi:uncharacterized protein YukE